MIRTLFRSLGLLAGLSAGLSAAPYSVDARVDRPVLDAHGDRTVTLRIDLEGLRERLDKRPPLNVTLVVDRSGSMAGDKIAKAIEAAQSVVSRLGKRDSFSLVSFDDQVRVNFPAAILKDRRAALNAISDLTPGGSTALYAGMQAGLEQAQRYAHSGRVNRVILLSDGLANVGPDKSADARALGRQAAKSGIVVSTLGLGLGYDEDLLTALSQSSDGNHAFIANSQDLTRVLDQELGDALAVAARDVVIEIHLADGVRYRRSLDRDVEQDGRTLRLRLGQLAQGQQKELLVQLEAPAGRPGDKNDLADVRVLGSDADGIASPTRPQAVSVGYSDDPGVVQARLNADVVADAVKAQANAAREEAVQLRDQGKNAQAAALLSQHADALRAAAKSLPAGAAGAPGYLEFSDDLNQEAETLASPSADWNAARKDLKAKAYQERSGQTY